jgi:2-(1,2-epoxy-1,2-dihydrophenyl)acetyl-CoA isomerase
VTVAASPYTERRGRVLRCVISTAEHGASLHGEAMRQATDALRALDEGVGAVLVVGEGPNFCTGGDLGAFAGAEDPGGFVRTVADAFHDFQRALLTAAVPVVAAVHGWAAGAGMSIVLAADVAIAGTSTRLRPAYPGIGFSPDGGMSWLLPRLAGAARARHILLTDQVLDAEQAATLGLVSAVVADADVAEEAERTARALAQGPTAALGRIKQLLHAAQTADLDTHLDAEAAAISASAAGAEGREGVAAFRERRAPRFH